MITLAYPAYDPAVTISIKNPEILDVLTSNNSISVSQTHDGNFNYTKTTSEKIVYTSVLNFRLSETDKVALETFLETARKHYILYTDYNNIQWVCIIVDPNISIKKMRPCWFELAITIDRWIL